MKRESVNVASILPLWRYAVGPTSGTSPAIPFWSLKEAKAFFSEAKSVIPWSSIAFYKRKGWAGIQEVIRSEPTLNEHNEM